VAAFVHVYCERMLHVCICDLCVCVCVCVCGCMCARVL